MVERKGKSDTTKSSEQSDPTSEQAAIVNLENALTHFALTFESSVKRWEDTIYPFIKSFEGSTKRWENMIYPAVFVFGILGLSGFWLIYSLTSDVHELAVNVDPKMERNLATISKEMSRLSGNIENMTAAVTDMKNHIATMDSSVTTMTNEMVEINNEMDTLPSMVVSMADMNLNKYGRDEPEYVRYEPVNKGDDDQYRCYEL
ncbi:MAG: hypothetical protein EP297_12700 [Gammaproteobacteria bacterium]|nr:MAG: hypothetical protein EP297_12700 [Gammaproteobacteria bacterium]